MMFVSLGIGTVAAVALIVVMSILTGGSVKSNNGLPTSALVGKKVASYSLSGLVSGTDKAPWASGHPGVLIFFASWCAPCRGEMPKVAKWVSSHNEGNVIVMGIEDVYKRQAWCSRSYRTRVPSPGPGPKRPIGPSASSH